MPKLWTATIEGHRRAVRDATLDATATLIAEQGPTSLTMSQIAERTGIGRATLYKYFADVEEVLAAWHERQVAGHLQQLVDARDAAGNAGERLEAVLLTYAALGRRHGNSAVIAQLHQGAHVATAHRRLRTFLQELLAEGARAGELRDDVPPEELAAFVLGALSATDSSTSGVARRRLVAVTLDGLRPPG